MSDHSLTLGSLLLTDSAPDADYGFTFSVLADGMSTGSSVAVKEIVTSLLADGDLVRTTRYGNREVSFAVQIEGPTLGSLARGEAALRAEVGRGNTLTWQAPDVLSVPTVFEVVDSEMSQTFDDLDELRRRRTFTLTLTCSPFAGSEGMVTVDALPSPGAPITATINNADNPADWFATASTAVGGPGAARAVIDMIDAVATTSSMPDPVGWGRWGLTLELSALISVDMTSTQYVRVESRGFGGAEVFHVKVDGNWRGIAPSLSRAIDDSFTEHFLDVSPHGSLVTGLRVIRFVDGPATLSITVRDVSRTNTLSQVSARQLTRIVEVGGTERTPCSLKVVPGAAEALGLAIVHTSPASGLGYSPALRQYRVSGNPETPEAGSLSGEKEAVTATPIVAQVPIASLPEDGYALMAYMRSSVAGTYPMTWQARTIVGSTYYGGHEGVANAYFPVADQWTMVPLAVVTLPPVRAAIGGVVQFNITRTVVSEEIYLDEWWAFRTGEDCALTIVQSDEASFLWLDSPDSSSPVPRVWVSNNSDRSDQRHPGPGLLAQGSHVLTPSATTMFVASSGIEYPALSATYRKRWHSNAAE